MIEIKNIKKSYSNLQVLKGINLIIPEKKNSNHRRRQRSRKKHFVAHSGNPGFPG